VSLLHDQRAAIGVNPGAHALIVGVSEYPHLGGGRTPVADPWDMTQLTSAASTAHKVFEWLKSATLTAPLATCRVLLSPSPIEAHLAGVADPATLANVKQEARAWRADAASHPDNVTFFYFAGHGVQRTKEDAVLCLMDFRDPADTVLHRAIDVATLFGGMSPSPTQPNIARTQFYFIDACRAQLAQLGKFATPQTSAVFDLELGGQDDRRAPIFFASVSNHVAAAIPGVQTLFSRALLECFEGAAGDSLGEDESGVPRWGVKLQSLIEALDLQVEDLNQELEGDQLCTVGGLLRPATVCLLDQAPVVKIVLTLDPVHASQMSRIVIRGNNQPDRVFTPPFDHPVEDEVSAGAYGIDVSFNPPVPPFVNKTKFGEARAPRSTWKVKVV
jgi:hypothetical protein